MVKTLSLPLSYPLLMNTLEENRDSLSLARNVGFSITIFMTEGASISFDIY